MRLKSFDNYLIIAMSALALGCIYMLYGTKPVNFNSNTEIKVASIVDQLKTVKRKRDYFQGWLDVKPGDHLTQDDEIYTHEQSSAHIKFANGPEINLFENSLLRIKSGILGNTMSLDKGNMIAKLSPGSPNFDIELNGKKYSFNSQNANIQIEQGETENKFLLLNGKAKLADQEILTNQVVILNIKTGELKIKEIPYIPKSPSHDKIQYYLQEATLNFSWNYVNRPIPAQIVIASDSKFSKIILKENIEANSFNTVISHEGTYYWKLTSPDLIDGPIKSFSLIEEIQPSLSTDQNIVYYSPKSISKVYLNWSKNNGNKYLIKIEHPDGNKEVLSTTKNYFDFLPKQLGDYLISVKVADKDRSLALWSEPISISVLEARPINISYITPEVVEKVSYNNHSSNYLLSWSGPLEGTKYTVSVIKNSKTTILDTEQTSAPLRLEGPGVYNWEVVGTSTAGMISNKINGKIIIKTPLSLSLLPSEGAIVELEKPDQLVAFKWDKVEEAQQYQFELSNEPTFKDVIISRDVDINNFSTSLAEIGKYYWRVKIKRGDSVEYSNPVSVEIKPAPPLERPEVSPDIKTKLKYLDETSSSFNLMDLFISKAYAEPMATVAEWDLPVNAKAKRYIVEIYKDPELKEMITSIETDAPKVVWKNAMAGTFYWRFSYMDFWGRKTEFSKISVLSTEDQEIEIIPIEIRLQSPKHRSKILREDIDQSKFNWEAILEAQNYQVMIARDLEFENIILNKTVTVNEIKVSCQDFDKRAGDYYWKIISGKNTSKRRKFSIMCTSLPPLKPVTIEEVSTEVLVEEKIIENKIIHNDHYLRIGFSPHRIAYENKAGQYSAKIDGYARNGWNATYQRPMDLWSFQTISPTLMISRGKVFKTITFTDVELNLKAKRKQMSFSWGPTLAFMKKTLYVESNLSIKDENLTSPLFGFFIQKDMDNITINAEFKLGTITNYHADIQYNIKNNYAVGAFFDSSSVTKNVNKHTFSSYGLNFNYTFDFLDKLK